MKKRPASMFILSMFLAGGLFTQSVLAKEYPSKPVEMVSHLTPGSIMEVLARLIANVSSKYLGQPMVVVNKPGGAGSVAVAEIIRAPSDGYKLLTFHSTYFATVAPTQKLQFDPFDITPIANFSEYKMGLAVKGDSPWKTFNELVEYGKKNPGKLRWSYASRGAPPHLNAMMLFRKEGLQTIELSYKGTPEQVAALLGGHLDAASVSYGPGVMEHVKAKTIKYLIFYGDRRYKALSDVPCALELGYPEAARLSSKMAVFAHKNTPEEVKKILFDAFKKTFEDPDFQKGCEQYGFEPRFGDGEFLKEEIKKEMEIGIPLIKELGLFAGK